MQRLCAIVTLLATSMTAAAADLPSESARPEINLRQTVTVSVVRQSKNAVVNISTTKLVQQRVAPFGGDPFWQSFDFGEIVKVPANSLGSGFIVHEDGYVVTNHHVIDRARQIDVELADGRKLQADLISSDAEADLAILKIHGDKPFPTLSLGDSADLLIGEPVIAVGNPLGFSHSVSTGIVSAVHRDLKDQQNQVMLGDLIQTDAAINPGNSGGPLLNAYGQVIGINTAIRGDAQNIGFAIAVNKLRDLIPELMNPAQVTKVDVPVKLFERRTVSAPAKVDVTVHQAAAGNGQPERAVKAINDQPVRDIVDAYAKLLRLKAEDKLTLAMSDGTQQTLATKMVPLPDAVIQARQRLGITIVPLSPILAQKYGLETDAGMFVSAVNRDSVAAKAGLQPGDVIVQIGRYRVGNLDDFSGLMQHLPPTGRVRVGVVRGNQLGYGILEL